MSSIQVPELYKEIILKDKKKESGKLGLSVNGVKIMPRLDRSTFKLENVYDPRETF